MNVTNARALSVGEIVQKDDFRSGIVKGLRYNAVGNDIGKPQTETGIQWYRPT